MKKMLLSTTVMSLLFGSISFANSQANTQVKFGQNCKAEIIPLEEGDPAPVETISLPSNAGKVPSTKSNVILYVYPNKIHVYIDDNPYYMIIQKPFTSVALNGADVRIKVRQGKDIVEVPGGVRVSCE